MKHFVIKDTVAVQINLPKISHNGFGYILNLKTYILVGKKSFGAAILGLGFSITWDKNPEKLWMWNYWKRAES